MTKTYTEEEVVNLLVKERERACKIATDFNLKYEEKSREYASDDKALIYIAEREAEVARKILITIDGRLLTSVNEPLKLQVRGEYFYKD